MINEVLKGSRLMRFERYDTTEAFADDVLEILLENEAQNNHPINIALTKDEDSSSWLLGSIKDEKGSIVLVTARMSPFNMVLYETGNKPNKAATKLLSDELKAMGYALPGVMAEQGLSQRFAEDYMGSSTKDGVACHSFAMSLMYLDAVNAIDRAPGYSRELQEDDLFFAPYWARAFSEDAHVDTFDYPEMVEMLRKRLNKDVHYFWIDGHPVSQAVNGRNTINGAVVNSVYTPPNFRGSGYASSVVAELSQNLLERGNRFCCLFADTKNPVSCGIYRKIGYRDLCLFEEIKFPS